MKMFVLSDNSDTWIGMRLAGIDGVVVHNREDIEDKITELLQTDEFGIILITEKLRAMADEFISRVMLTHKKPLILEIPDRHGFGRSKSSITDYIKKTIGLNL